MNIIQPGLIGLWIIGNGLMGQSPLAAADPFKELVRPTEALSPAEEQALLTVPEGFTISLFASEPMINKPINLAFDERGRLWVSSTVEYPKAALPERWADPTGSSVRDSRDAIKILEDTDGDGRADKVTDFADRLNIPTGVLPWRKGDDKAGCLAWSIPNIWYFGDKDGDGKCDTREVLFGPLGWEKDTHGMCSSFRFAGDGWIYATHGFSNTSRFVVREDLLGSRKAGDPGTFLELHSGNVFRFRPDGSAIEAWSRGQVNPFGLTWDRFGNLYSADCHSAPIYQLLRGAVYPSFGKPHDGVGFGPVMMTHQHGSTGICGIACVDGGMWGKEWDDRLFIGNVVTSRVNADRIEWQGATAVAREEADFVVSGDPWFRPVDLQIGPDDALYIADFYNKIIGHYEVPIDHPGRDRERGRIWQVTKNDRKNTLKPLPVTDTAALLKLVSSPNPTLRDLALREGYRQQGAWPLMSMGEDDAAAVRINGLIRTIYLRDSQKTGTMERQAEYPESELGQVLQLRQWTELGMERESDRAQILESLQNGKPLVRRAAAEFFQIHPAVEAFPLLIGLLPQANETDPALAHVVKMALREHLRLPEVLASLEGKEFVEPPGWDDLLLSAPSSGAAQLVKGRLSSGKGRGGLTDKARFLALYLPPEELGALPALLAGFLKDDNLAKSDCLEAMRAGLWERGDVSLPAEWLSWGREIASSQLKNRGVTRWKEVPGDGKSPWVLQRRGGPDGAEHQMISSLDGGGGEPESRTGVLKSDEFMAPAILSFWICGHRGPPGAEAHEKNQVRLVDATDGTVYETAFPPRNDVAVPVEWKSRGWEGKKVRLEVVDGDNGKAYAWLAVGHFGAGLPDVAGFSPAAEEGKRMKFLAEFLAPTAPAALREALAPWMPAASPPPREEAMTAEERNRLENLVALRVGEWEKQQGDAEKGAALFGLYCALCHQVEGKGQLVGPQLDGIGQRGAARLCEDILDPHRNVDAHFRLHILTMKDGSMKSGIVRGEVGSTLLLVDAAGQETRVPMSDITKRNETGLSLMPSGLGEGIPAADFRDLLSFLLKK